MKKWILIGIAALTAAAIFAMTKLYKSPIKT